MKLILLFLLFAFSAICVESANNVIINKANKAYFLNHGQKVAISLTGTMREQFISRWEVKKEEIPNGYQVLDFARLLDTQKPGLQKNKNNRKEISAKTPKLDGVL